VKAFVTSQDGGEGCFRPCQLDAQAVRAYLLDRTCGRSSAYARLVATSLRSFLRFLFLRGATVLDLSMAVPIVRRWSRAPLHAFRTPEVVERVLAVADRSTPSRRRDYAMLLLLARLGLRAGEVVALELDDIRWRSAEIVIRGKGRHVDLLPLVADVGEALADYLQAGRGATTELYAKVDFETLRGVALAWPGTDTEAEP
jgi:integrase/recombinase XerD